VRAGGRSWETWTRRQWRIRRRKRGSELSNRATATKRKRVIAKMGIKRKTRTNEKIGGRERKNKQNEAMGKKKKEYQSPRVTVRYLKGQGCWDWDKKPRSGHV